MPARENENQNSLDELYQSKKDQIPKQIENALLDMKLMMQDPMYRLAHSNKTANPQAQNGI